MKRFMTVTIAALVLGACGGDSEGSSSTIAAAAPAPTATAPAATTTTTTAPTTTTTLPTTTTLDEGEPVEVTRDVAYRQLDEPAGESDLRTPGAATTGQLDVWAPTSAGPWPVLVVLHGQVPNSRSGYDALAERIAAGGAVVYNVDWPVDIFFQDAEIVACAIGFARSTAADYGGSPDRVTVLGHSAGAATGATVALAAELLSPIEDCATTDASIIPDVLVGVAGRYDYAVSGIARGLKESDPAAWEIVDPYTNIGRNPDLEVYLLHGDIDDWNPVQSSIDFDQALRDAGYAVHLTVLEGVGHNSPVAPTFDAFWVTVDMAIEAAGG
ncbi:MAG: hypothetical protein OEM94_04230 [Acidimicrobiia bacterium]|nr:hypothetical protein [Acidimicrobiia bacterium]MDH3470506.1 hypothetical protein [Acidimicrobiia bacterium]